MRVLVVGPVGGACGIAEYGAMLRDSLERQGVSTSHTGDWAEQGLNPATFNLEYEPPTPIQIVHLNYHAALHSQWHQRHILALQHLGFKVIVTYHDTRTTENSQQAKDLCAVADAFIVHERVEDLPGAVVIPQPVPVMDTFVPYTLHERDYHHSRRPVIGTVGFPLPWKNYGLLCDAARLAGWKPVIISAGATPADVADWTARCPWGLYLTEFLSRDEVLSILCDCDATAFLYTCHNAGTSGAIRQGLATGLPLLAMRGCRQFTDLWDDLWARDAVEWVEFDADQIAHTLSTLRLGINPRVIRLAHEWSWDHAASHLIEIYKQVLA